MIMNSKLQIISGKYRGKKLNLPTDARPTQNLARGALFNMLEQLIDFSKKIIVWDVFAGSGAIGLEFLSRYDNVDVVFTDNASTSINTIKKNLVSIKESATVEKNDAIVAISRFGGGADVIFIDAPYSDFDLGAKFVKKLTPTAKGGAILIWEFEKIQQTPDLDKSWEILKDKTYGRARFLILQKK